MSETAVPTPNGRLVFACSGAADVGEITDRVARLLNREGAARMFCLGCIGAQNEGSKDCAKKCLEQAGLTRIRHLRLTDHQMEKGKTPVSVHNVQAAAERAKHVLLVP
jgi:uncharacterized metal-binding protein